MLWIVIGRSPNMIILKIRIITFQTFEYSLIFEDYGNQDLCFSSLVIILF